MKLSMFSFLLLIAFFNFYCKKDMSYLNRIEFIDSTKQVSDSLQAMIYLLDKITKFESRNYVFMPDGRFYFNHKISDINSPRIFYNSLEHNSLTLQEMYSFCSIALFLKKNYLSSVVYYPGVKCYLFRYKYDLEASVYNLSRTIAYIPQIKNKDEIAIHTGNKILKENGSLILFAPYDAIIHD